MDAEVGLAKSELVGLAIIIVVIACLTIAHHGHHKRERVLTATMGVKSEMRRKKMRCTKNRSAYKIQLLTCCLELA